MQHTAIDHDTNRSSTPLSEVELACAIRGSDLFLQYEGGLAPESAHYLAECERVLDLACGPGGWALQVATAYPKLEVVGVDRNAQVLDYARARARARRLSNARFQEVDITQPFCYPDASFDLVNARFLQGVLARADWPRLVRQCLRILRPGGLLRLTEFEIGVSNLPATNRLLHLLPLALYHAGQSFAPVGTSMGITYMLGHFLRAEGYVGVIDRAFVVDSSVGTPAYQSFNEFLRITFNRHLLGDYFLNAGLVQEAEYEELYECALREMFLDEFCSIAYFLTVVGSKPARDAGASPRCGETPVSYSVDHALAAG